MNKHLNGGNEMKGLKMKIGSLIGVLLFCASAQTAAEVCEAEIEQAMSTDLIRPRPNRDSRAKYEFGVTQVLKKPCNDFRWSDDMASIEKAISYNVEKTEKYPREMQFKEDLAHLRVQSCVYRAKFAQCSSSTAPTPPSGTTNTNRPASVNPASANSQEAQRLNTQLSEAEARAQNNQAKVDRARKGKPKRHVPGAEAHHCLKPQKGGGVVNSCPFAIEYNYCVYRPPKDSWSASFDCEKNQGGAWQVGAGPNNRSIMHTGGEWVYWFACKYGSDFSHPDGISPADIEYVPGRGLVGRCAEWGSGGSTASGGSNQASPLPATPQRCSVDQNRKCIGPRGCIQPPGGCIQ